MDIQNNDNGELQQTNLLFKAIEAGNVASVSKILQAGADLNIERSAEKFTALEFAIYQYFKGFDANVSYEAFVRGDTFVPFSDENKNHQDIIVLIQKHLNKTDISQGVILQKFMRFLSIIYKNNPPQFESALLKNLFSIKEGTCSGFSAVFSDYASQEKEKQFIEDLKTIANWDGNQDTLMRSESLFNTIRTMYDNVVFIAFEASMNSLNQNIKNEKENEPLKKENQQPVQQKDWNYLLNLISDRKVTRKKEFEVIFCYTSSELAHAINTVVLENKSVRFSFLGHTTELHRKNGKFMYYDPNSSDEPHFVDSAEEVVTQVQASIAKIEKATLTPDSLIDIEMQVFNFNDSPAGHYPDLKEFINTYVSKRKDPFSINELIFTKNSNALANAISEDSVENVQALLSAGADPNLAMLLISVFSTKPNQLEIVQLLLDNGFDPNLKIPDSENKLVPFYEEMQYFNPQMHKLFLDKATHSASTESNLILTPEQALYTTDSTLFSQTCEQALKEGKLNNHDIIKLQKTLKIIVDYHQNRYQPSETILAEYQKMDAMLTSADKLLTKESDASHSNVYAPSMALDKQKNIFLKSQDNDIEKLKQTNLLFKAIETGDVDSARKMIQAGADLNAVNDQGYTPLSSAISTYFKNLKIGTYDNTVLPFSHENENHHEIIVLIQKNLDTIDVSQFLIAQKFMRFLSIIYQNDPHQFETETLKYLAGLDSGACNGFSAILSDLASQGKASQFIDELKLIASWDGEKDSLIQSPHLFATIRTMYDNSVFLSYLQSKTILENFLDAKESSPLTKKTGHIVQQKDWDYLTRLISDRPVERTKEFEMVFSYRSNELVDAINKIALEGKSVRLSFKHHTMTLFKENGKFMFYDPNSPDIPHFVDTAEEVVKQVETAYTRFEKNKVLKLDSLMEIEMQVFNFNNSPPGKYPDINNLIRAYLADRKDSSSINDLNFSKIAKTNALGTAIFLDSRDSVETLLSAGADPNLALFSLMNFPEKKPNSVMIFAELLDNGLDPRLTVPTWNGELKPFYECIANSYPKLSKMLQWEASNYSPVDVVSDIESTLYQANSDLFSEKLNQALKNATINSSDIQNIQKKLNIIIDVHKSQYTPSEKILAECQKMDTLLTSADKLLTKKSDVSNSKVYTPLSGGVDQEKTPRMQTSDPLLENKVENKTPKLNNPKSS